MRRQIPSLSALEAFEAVARLGSTTKAADELGRTQSAVSRQILNLEAFTRRPLFERNHNRLQLNPAGQHLFDAIGRALDRLEHAVGRAAAFSDEHSKIVLRVWPTFGARWLMSRLALFPGPKLGLEVELTIGLDGDPDLRAQGVDAIILYGLGEWPELTAYSLFPENLVAVTTPRLFDRLGTDLSAYQWLHMAPRPQAWRQWIETRADPSTPIKEGPIHQVSMLIELTCLGQGVTVVPSVYVERELANGALIAPFGEPLPTGRGYYLCYMREDAEKPAFVAFKDWLLGTC